ncbi:MAG: 4-(cytidine 5'-diphospho)-2-C-methyl-D-erythritol kinase [Dehalococcoidales bacterium]|nr:4-(cytidine 5'-diphospho)-2-C-methyl-D-erythritol kinase [Dehalococcoidales bacterium]
MKLTVKAPAKINLTLEVLSKRNDGYHEIRSVIQTIDLCDVIMIKDDDGTSFQSATKEWDAEKSLVSQALNLFRETTGFPKGIFITVEKNIPMMAGLGGDSSDAAAVLWGLNRFCETNLPHEELHRMAEQLGSDVPFFLYGGTALIEGKGEIVTPLPSVTEMCLVLAVPSIGILPGKTGRLFQSLSVNHYTDGEITRRFVDVLTSGEIIPPLFNTFENTAYDVFPGLDVFKEHFLKLGAEKVHLAGSGPVLFTVVPDLAAAEDLYRQLEKQRMNPIISKTVSKIEKID